MKETSIAKPARKVGPFKMKVAASLYKWMIRRIKRLWSSWVLRILDLKFPTIGAHLSEKKKDEVRRILHPGDILLEDNSSYLFSQFGARIIGSAWSHSAFYIGDGKVIDCGTKPYVAQVELSDFLNTSDIAVYRPQYETQEDLESALTFVRSCIDRPFNRTFNLSSENSFYCTQLIYRALKQMPRPIILSVSKVFKKPVILVSSIEHCPNIQLLWVSRNGFLKGCLVHLPSVLAAVLCGSLGGLLSPSYAFFGGAVGLAAILAQENLFYSDTLPKRSMTKCLEPRRHVAPVGKPKEKLS